MRATRGGCDDWELHLGSAERTKAWSLVSFFRRGSESGQRRVLYAFVKK